jgi:hypothetical protein
LTLTAQQDTYVNQILSTVNYGADARLEVGRGGYPPVLGDLITLLRFDLGALPPNAYVLNARLELYLLEAGGPEQYEIWLEELAGDWQEMSVTWENMPEASYVGTVAVSSASGWKTWQVTDLANKWVADASKNFGLRLSGDGETQGRRSFGSRHGATPPRLIIQYAIDTTPPSNPNTFTSPSHAIGVWSSNPWVTVNWSGASDDGGSGVYGYSYAWSHSPILGLVDETVDTMDTMVTSQLSDGYWWFYVRTRDVAGNWSGTSTGYGPFQIDTTPPSNPTTFTSSHTPGVWSSSPSVTVNWSGASDGSGSGVYGYSYGWSPLLCWPPPDTTVDTTGNSATSQLSDGQWLFCIRTRDVEGNWNSSAAPYGPLYIDTEPPTAQVTSPYHTSSKTFTVSWSGSDATSGVASYDVQYLDMTGYGGGWKDWQITTTATSASFTGQDGHTYRFRVRARDNAGNVDSWLAVTQFSETHVETIDFQVIGLEVTQGIQDLNNSVLLVEGKRTFVRLHVRSTTGDLGPVDAELRAYRNGQWLGSIPANNPGGMITVRQDPDRGQRDHSFYFDLPSQGTISSWLYGPVHLEAEVNKNGADWSETSYANNTASADVVFKYTPMIRVNLFDVFYTLGNNTFHVSDSDIFALASWLGRIYPVPGVKWSWWTMDWGPATTAVKDSSIILTSPDCLAVDDELLWHRSHNALFSNEPPQARYYGMVSQAGGFMRGCSPTSPSWVASGPITATLEWYGSHELGHAYAQPHTRGTQPPPCGDCSTDNCGPWGTCGCEGEPGWKGYTDGNISPTQDGSSPSALYGFDIETLRVYAPDWKDNMTYCHPEWISDYTYEDIHRQILLEAGLPPASMRPASTQEYLAVFGRVYTATGQVELDAFYRVPNAWDVLGRVPGEYSIRLLGAGGNTLADYPFTPKFSHVDPGPTCQAGAQAEVPALIAEYVLWVDGTAHVAIYHGGQELASRPVSAHAPHVTLTYPNGGEVLSGNQITVTWTGSDVDGDGLSYALDYSLDNGAYWRALGNGITTTSLLLDAAFVPGTSQGKFRILASDGVNTAWDDSDGTFTVPNKAPRVQVTSPTDEARYVPGQTVALVASAIDLEDGTLGDAALSWTSSLSGTVGIGHMLHVTDFITGTHVITLTATDSGGTTTAVTRTIHVEQYLPSQGQIYLPIVLKNAR